MRNLCSIVLPNWYPPLKQLFPTPHLHTLSLNGWDHDCLDPLRELSGLRSLSVELCCFAELTLDSALTVALLNSRDTLTKLSLDNFEWLIPTHSANLGELIWPNVVELGMWGRVEDCPDSDLNLAHHFPSVRQFGCKTALRGWDRPFNVPFMSRLSSLDAPLDLVKFSRDIGGPLQRAVIYLLNDYTQLDAYLPPDIRSIKFDYGIECTIDPLRQLEELATACRRVAYLAVDCKLDPRPVTTRGTLQLLYNCSVECLSPGRQAKTPLITSTTIRIWKGLPRALSSSYRPFGSSRWVRYTITRRTGRGPLRRMEYFRTFLKSQTRRDVTI
ncbi:hypothetical protein BOTBODRAFT_527104 [Botryobasidium botryosum FD-172 SS1]|uniref:F-box domain-containing protein n=1 Tax=Botryobasidium botryosum (strain FD-172 SS1) TaxID=930990 RepID=A0A067MC55_BOTB1|nr:hypothetical protein BOTBODRAFT_527104 [Botryobasidium botryosum FD-172 SS1]